MSFRRHGILSATALIFITGCAPGDPRTTQIENRSPFPIKLSYLDDAFNMKGDRIVEPKNIGDLWPNYLFRKLSWLHVVENGHLYHLDKVSAASLQRACQDYCTLTYYGNGRFSIRKWEGFK